MFKKVCFVLWTIAVYTMGSVQNPAQVRPESYKVEIDNPKVHVVRSFHAAHEKVPMHSHGDAVVVYLSDVHEKSTYPDGTSNISNHRAGDVIWSPAHSHAIENLADEPIRVIEIEPKTPAESASRR